LWGTFVGTLCILPLFRLSLGHCRLSLKSNDLLFCIEPLELFHGLRLVLLRGVSIAKDRLNSGMPWHRRQRNLINAGHSGARCPCGAKIIARYRSNPAVPLQELIFSRECSLPCRCHSLNSRPA